ncbi:MAG TPA: adenylate/guanylate cyclase domain-containing protein [Candidatus Didemnitutus sp.]
MDSAPPISLGPGQRLLAAIVFTDTVSFSARMQTEEVATLDLLEKDFAAMRAACEKYSGSVLKTTGDGLLLYFTSAVNAVTCSMKIQRAFTERKKSDPAADALTHRFGIHLGDVFVNNEDVMGDGVNIAARLQAQADPGGICISQTVYDVVKNKISLDVEKLEGRELKNISEAVTIYRVLLDAPKPRLRPRAAPTSPLLRPDQAGSAPAMSGRQKLLILAGVLAGAALVLTLLLNSYQRAQAEIAASAKAREELSRRLEQHPATDLPVSPRQPTAATETDFNDLLKRAGTPNAPGAPETASARDEAAALIPSLDSWALSRLAQYNGDRPLLVRPLPGLPGRETQVYTDDSRRLLFAEGGATRARAWSGLKPEEVAAIVVNLVSDSIEPPPAAIRRAADAYAYLHGLPAMAAALHRGD